MNTSFYNGISGIKSFQSGIDIWGDNISNINTPGFKESTPEFETVFSNAISSSPITSDIGNGSVLSTAALNLQTGSLKATDNPFDLAIDGKGWFKVKNGNNVFYTKTGSFSLDKDGYLTDPNGNYLIVANADNLKKNKEGYYIDKSINTDNLIKSGKMSPISLPENITLPAIATTKIDLKANLNNSDTLLNKSKAASNLYFSALYNQNGENLHMVDNQSLVYKLGDIKYDKGIFSDEICINDDIKDGQNVNYNFEVNGKKINLSLPDGSTKETILKELAAKLKENNIDYETTDNSIIIKSKNHLIIKSENDLIPNAYGAILVYKNEPENPYEFNTMDSLKDILQQMLDTVYPNDASVTLENGQFAVYNKDTKTIIKSTFEKTENTNNLFFDNIASLGNTILPNTAAKSSVFTANTQSFGGDLYDQNGNKDNLSIQFTKKEVLNEKNIWEAKITIKNDDKIISQKTQDYIFDSQGTLISPKSITLDSPQQITLDTEITSYSKIDKLSYSYSQNGLEKGFLKNYNIENNGDIFALFSNGKASKLATIPLFHFQNPQGLQSLGSNLFKETSNSNKAFLYENNGKYIPGSNIHSHTLETSNVDFSQAMTELIINQKAYGAAAKAITTSDQMIQKAINMKS